MLEIDITRDVSPEVLEKSITSRTNIIDWSSLKRFQTALEGWSTKKPIRVRIAATSDSTKPDRPMAVFYVQKSGRKRIEEAYYLSDEEVLRFQAKLRTIH